MGELGTVLEWLRDSGQKSVSWTIQKGTSAFGATQIMCSAYITLADWRWWAIIALNPCVFLWFVLKLLNVFLMWYLYLTEPWPCEAILLYFSTASDQSCIKLLILRGKINTFKNPNHPFWLYLFHDCSKTLFVINCWKIRESGIKCFLESILSFLDYYRNMADQHYWYAHPTLTRP